jgi:spore maturation protein CgeB
MGLNLSRGKPIKYYSSDRLVQIIGNGLLCFIDEKTKLQNLIPKTCAVYYSNLNDLTNKITYYKKNPIKMKKIASYGKKFYNLNFNSTIVSKFIIDKTFKINKKDEYSWIKK